MLWIQICQKTFSKIKIRHIRCKHVCFPASYVMINPRKSPQSQKYIVGFKNSNTIVIAIDGGRLRVRKKKRGPKTAKKRNKFNAQWREVKLFVIYVVDNKGNKIKKELPIIDGIIGSPQAVFDLIKKYLLGLTLENINNIVFVADGAPWIWKQTSCETRN